MGELYPEWCGKSSYQYSVIFDPTSKQETVAALGRLFSHMPNIVVSVNTSTGSFSTMPDDGTTNYGRDLSVAGSGKITKTYAAAGTLGKEYIAQSIVYRVPKQVVFSVSPKTQVDLKTHMEQSCFMSLPDAESYCRGFT